MGTSLSTHLKEKTFAFDVTKGEKKLISVGLLQVASSPAALVINNY